MPNRIVRLLGSNAGITKKFNQQDLSPPFKEDNFTYIQLLLLNNHNIKPLFCKEQNKNICLFK